LTISNVSSKKFTTVSRSDGKTSLHALSPVKPERSVDSNPETCMPSSYPAKLVWLFALLLFASIPTHAQGDPTLERGLKPYGSFEGGSIDSISTTNGNLNIHIPLVSYQQRGGKLNLSFSVQYRNNSYVHSGPGIPDCVQTHNNCTYGDNVSASGLEITNNLNLIANAAPTPPANGPYAYIQTPDHSWHQMGPVAAGLRTTDASGFLCLNNCATLIDRNGIRYTQQMTKFEDPNGNFISGSNFGSNGAFTSYTDTMERTIPLPPVPSTATASDTTGCTGTLTTEAAYIWSLPGYQGGQLNYKVCYATVYYGAQICVQNGGAPSCGISLQHTNLIQSIVLPNSTAWTFQYASANPNDPTSSASGSLLQITFPTGGYIKYGWTPIYMCQTPTASTFTTYTYAVTSRTINANDGTGEHQTVYSFQNVQSGQFSTSSVDPLGQKTVHTLSPEGGVCSYYETQTQTYNIAGSLQKTITTDYLVENDALWFGSSTSSNMNGVLPIRVTTTWPNGQVAKVETDYDSGTTMTGNEAGETLLYGIPIARREYDYGSGGPGPLLRTTTTSYQALGNSAYLNNNLLTLPSSVVIADSSGTTAASSTYSYDQFSLANSSVTAQHDSPAPDGSSPGNLTTVVRGFGSTTTTSFYDTGNPHQVTDPNGNTTTSTYSSTFLGAYVTQVKNALGQSTYHNYDLNSGLLTSTTDLNNQTTSFTYDNMWRLNCITYPTGGGQVCIIHQEITPPFSATATKEITSSPNLLNEVRTDIYDGLGRVTQTQLTSDPQGTVYTDTIYDALGRVSTVSNPYRAGTDATSSPGITTYAYDALDRKISETYPGNSVLTTAYCGSSTLVTDPVGKWRRSRADGLGRLVEVDEPNAIGATVNANGCPAQSDPILVTSYTNDAVGNLTQVVQNGSHQRTFSYDLLSHLVFATNPESGTIIYEYDPNGNITQKTDARSLRTDYTYDALNRLTGKTFSDHSSPVAFFYDGQTPPATNPTSASGSVTITGGERFKITNPCLPAHRNCPVTTYDSGGVSITVNGVTNSASYGQGSTPSTISSALASAINSNANSPVTASASNATVLLTAKAAGTASDYSLSATAATNDPTDFPGASFSALPFGFTLDGGCNVFGAFTVTNGVGRRTGTCDATGAAAWSYDTMGRVTTNQRSINGVTKSTSYQYTLDGLVSNVTYPSGRVVNYTYDGADRPSNATDGSSGITYAADSQTPPTGTTCVASRVCYTPQGSFYALSIGQSASFTGFNISHTYSPRLQPNEFKASSTGGNAIDITYSFVDPATSKNAGHVNSITNNLNSSRSQSFTYDQLNRIKTAGTSATTGQYCWGYDYSSSYDAWGNLQSQPGAPAYTGCSQLIPPAMTADGNNHLSGLTYDPSGNTLTDGANTYTWDAESQMKTAAGVTYAYDGDGRRVSKSNGKLYWYGSGREILAETDASGNTTNEYIFFGGQRIATLPVGSTPLYYAEDFLGSSRVMVTSTGVVCYDADFTPFGGERAYTNTCQQNYKFEGKERDTETGNDDFGARYYSNRLGRWLSSDWSAVPVAVPYANLTNPQTLNLYSIVSDDPESFADLDGHVQQTPGNTPCGYEGAADCQQQQERQTEGAQAAQNQPQVQSTSVSDGDSYKGTSAASVYNFQSTTTFNADGTQTRTDIATSVYFSNAAGHEGEYLGATQFTRVVKSGNDGSSSLTTSEKTIGQKEAQATVGNSAFHAAQGLAAQPNRAAYFGSAVAADAKAHPGKYVAAAAGVASGGSSLGGYAVAAGVLRVIAGAAALYEAVTHALP
jgi:RHS repeat-associated protein